MTYTAETWPRERWPNFPFREMCCKETGECDVEPIFMDRLQGLRTDIDRALYVLSGYRSPRHSVEAKKDDPTAGAHPQGIGADILVRHGGEVYEVVEAAIRRGFTGIGYSLLGKTKFIHIDIGGVVRPFHVHRPAMWGYPVYVSERKAA